MKRAIKRVKGTRNAKRHVIIGNCIAAVSAADTLRKLSPDDSIVILGDEAVPSYSRCLITYYLGDMITESHLLSHTDKWYEERDIELNLLTRAIEVDTKNRVVHAEKNGAKKRFPYDTLLIATGSSSVFMKSYPYDPDGIIGMRNYADARRLKRWSGKGKRAIVIGAGFIALKTAYGLVRQGVQVKVVARSTVLRRMTDNEARRRVIERLTSHELLDIQLLTSVIETRKHGKRYVVTYQDGSEDEADFIVSSVGVKANTDFIEGTDVEIDGIIKVDDCQRTTAEGVYAAGDVCRSRHIVTREWISNAIWPVAVAQGRVAAYNMSGQKRTYDGEIPMNSVDFYELWVTSIGDVQTETRDIEEIKFETSGIYQNVQLKDGIPVCFIAVGNIDGAGIIRGAIVGRMPWEDFVKRPHAQLLPVASQMMG